MSLEVHGEPLIPPEEKEEHAALVGERIDKVLIMDGEVSKNLNWVIEGGYLTLCFDFQEIENKTCLTMMVETKSTSVVTRQALYVDIYSRIKDTTACVISIENNLIKLFYVNHVPDLMVSDVVGKLVWSSVLKLNVLKRV